LAGARTDVATRACSPEAVTDAVGVMDGVTDGDAVGEGAMHDTLRRTP